MEIPLKRKYRTHKPVKSNKAVGDHNNKRTRRKIGRAKHEARYGPQPTMIMLVSGTGKKRMVRA